MAAWRTTTREQGYCNIARRQRDWGPSWKPTMLINTDQTTASIIHQLRLRHGHFKPFLTRLPSYGSAQYQCSERMQGVKHLPLTADYTITKDNKLESLERPHCAPRCSLKGTTILQEFIQTVKIATGRWLLQGADKREKENE